MFKVVVAGGSGLVGQRLIQRLAGEKADVVLLSRREAIPGLPEGVQMASWGNLEEALSGAQAVINLAGEGIADARWTPARKEILRSSRIETTASLVAALGQASRQPAALVNASAIGIYGAGAEAWLDEDSPPGTGFLPDLCRDWERTADAAIPLGIRVVKLRIGVVLGREGGALPKMAAPVKFFLGAPLGHGRQGISWIHIEDLVSMILQAAQDPSWEGAMNATAPEPLSNEAFTRTLGRVLRRPVFPVPAWMTSTVVKLLAGEVAEDLLLSGALVLPKRAQERGFVFRFPSAEAARRDLLS